MTDRNERHFLAFYTPARQRKSRLAAARRHANTERKQIQTPTTPFSHDKENPTNGAVPATIPGEKAVGIGRQRRRLFTRSASKKKYADGSNDVGTKSNHGNLMTPETEFASPPVSGSKLSRALFSTDGNTSPMTESIDENAVSPDLYSPPGSSNLLKEYRSKKSLLSSSKTRTSSFSSLRPSSLWKSGKGDRKISEEDQKNNSNDNPLEDAIERSQTKPLETAPTDIETTTPTDLDNSPTDTLHNSVEITTPTFSNPSPITPKTTPKRSVLWSPPGTSKLLRKYRQRTQQLYDPDPSTFQSPPNASKVTLGRIQTTPRGRKGLRLLDSGAKRCRNNRLSLRPRPAVNEVSTPANAKIRATIKTSTKAKESIKMTNANRSLLSPSTAKRLNKDINSYRHAHGRAKLPNKVGVKDNDSSSEEVETEADRKDNNDDSNRDGNENYADQGGLETSPYKQFLPALSASDDAEGHAVELTKNIEHITDSLPFDEHNAEILLVQSFTPDESPVQAKVTNDTSGSDTKSPEAVSINPIDEDATEIGVFRSTRSASRRQSTHDAAKAVSTPDVTGKIKGEEQESGVFRSTRSATRVRRKLVLDKEESSTSANATRKYSKDEKEESRGMIRSTRSATRAHRKSRHEEVEASITVDETPVDSKDDLDEGSIVFRSTRSTTRDDRKSVHESVEATLDSAATIMDFKNDEEEGNGVFRSTRSSTSARRKSLLEAGKAISAVEASITGKSIANVIDDSIVVDAASCGDSKSDLSSPLPLQNGNDSPSSKGSLQSIWDVLHCGGGESSIDSSSSENIVSRVGDCVNPMALTLMKMWRDEENAAVGTKKEIEALQETNGSISATLSATSKGVVDIPVFGLKTPPPKSFSTDLNLVYGLERVQNLTLARPKALQATRSMNGDSSSTASQAIIIPPLAPCSQ